MILLSSTLMTPILAVTRLYIANLVSTAILVYTIIIFIAVLLSWLPRMPQNPIAAGLVRFVRDATEPYLRIFRRVIPPISLGGGGLDLSPLAGLLVLYILQQVIPPLIAG